MSKEALSILLDIDVLIMSIAFAYLCARLLRNGIRNKFRQKKNQIKKNYIAKNRYKPSELQREMDLKSLGIKYKYGSEFSYFDWLCKKIPLALALFLICAIGNVSLGIVAGVIGFFVPDILAWDNNRSDNDAMLEDISQMVQIAALQFRVNVPIRDVLLGSAVMTKHPRLKRALSEFEADVALKESVAVAAQNFSEKFRNEYISSYAKALILAEEGGVDVNAFNDLLETVNDIYDTMLKKREQGLSRIAALFTFLIFSVPVAFIVFVMYQMFTSGMSNLM